MRRLHGPAMTALTMLLILVAVGPWVVVVASQFIPDTPRGYYSAPGHDLLLWDGMLTRHDRLGFLFYTLFLLQISVGLLCALGLGLVYILRGARARLRQRSARSVLRLAGHSDPSQEPDPVL